MITPAQAIQNAFHEDDAASVRQLLKQHPELKARINEPIPECFDSPPINLVRSRAMLDALVEAGANLDAKSRWWAGGFGLLHQADPDLARYAIERGATVDILAAARLGLLDRLRALIEADPSQVHARGGDGQTPLHFACNVEIAAFLVERGADLDARDVDHESTPAQYMLDGRHEVARFLVQRGCKTDLLMATALGDATLVRHHLDQDPDSIRMRVTNEYFPMIGHRSGGTIYQWTLGWYVSAHQVARKFGHEEIVQLLMERSPADVKLVAAAWLGDERMVKSVLAEQPALIERLADGERRQLAHAARNNNLNPVRLMLDAGWPVHVRGQHQATPLHWAAWHGNAEMVELILRHHPAMEDTENDFQGTPLRWAIHGSDNGWHRETGEYGRTVELLLNAGAKPPSEITGSEAVRQALNSRG
jgi:hypothetical protein